LWEVNGEQANVLQLGAFAGWKQYLTSYYWAVYSVSTVGYGDIVPQSSIERLFGVLAMIVGAILVQAGITAILTAIITTSYNDEAKSRLVDHSVTSFVKSHGLSESPSRVARQYVKWLTGRMNDTHVLADDMPPHLRIDTLVAIVLSKSKSNARLNHALLKLEYGALRAMVSHCSIDVFVPGQLILSASCSTQQLAFVLDGVAMLTSCKTSQVPQSTKRSFDTGSPLGMWSTPPGVPIAAESFCTCLLLRLDHEDCVTVMEQMEMFDVESPVV
jgi:hypothetical protein